MVLAASIGFSYELGFSCVAGFMPSMYTLDSILSTAFESYIRVVLWITITTSVDNFL